MGLKSFSRQVWVKVKSKRETDYDEVAEEMLIDLKADALAVAQQKAAALGPMAAAAAPPLVQQFDERNVRRRVYDALNVLMAVGVISKDKLNRKIVWKGLANKGQDEAEMLEVRSLAALLEMTRAIRACQWN